jgi:tryptophanyl-tRNA synthetase
LALKIRKAKTDALPIPETKDALADRPEARNLIGIYASLTNKSVDEICAQHQGQLFSEFKGHLTDAVIHHLGPIRVRINQLMNDHHEIDSILDAGAKVANEKAESTMKRVRPSLNLQARK